MKILFLFCAIGALAVSAFAQKSDAPSPVKKAVPPVPLDAVVVRETIENAKAAAKSGNVTQAEQAIVALNRAKPDTSAYSMETAQRLLGLAEQLAREGQTEKANALASRALQNLTQAETRAKNAAGQAQAKTLAGMIYERYLGDSAAALSAYQTAAQLSPDTATQAQEMAERLKQADDIVKAKIAAGGK
jgi:tetratricopeptide (TPR) repeat protein